MKTSAKYIGLAVGP